MVTAKRYNRLVERKGRPSPSRPLTLFAGPSLEVNYGRLLVSGSSLGSSTLLCNSRPPVSGILSRRADSCLGHRLHRLDHARPSCPRPLEALIAARNIAGSGVEGAGTRVSHPRVSFVGYASGREKDGQPPCPEPAPGISCAAPLMIVIPSEGDQAPARESESRDLAFFQV